MRGIHISTVKDLLVDVARLRPAAVLSIEHPGASSSDATSFTPRLDPYITPQMIQTYWDIETPHAQGPSQDDVRHGLEFLQSYESQGPLMVHCRHGKSRSVAMALAWLVMANPDKPIPDLIAHLKTLRPECAPNIAIIRHADRLLHLGGALELAVLDDPDFAVNRQRAALSRARYAEKNPGLFGQHLSPI